MLDRRSFVKTGFGLLTAVALAPTAALATPRAGYVTTARRPDGSFAAIVLDEEGAILFEEPLQARGHDIAVAPDGSRAVFFARRPGRFAVVVDLKRRRATHTIPSIEGRHFAGHGFFSPDGALLYATENAYDLEAGMLGVYDVAADFRRIGEIETGGLDPHQALPLADGRTVAIANGGILTHPDFGREKLNLATMEPTLCYVDRITGDLVEKTVLPANLHQLSIRHMSIDRHGAVWFGGQYEGPAEDDVLLVGRHQRGGEPALVDAPLAATRGLRNYVGSVSKNRSGSRIATTSPRGGSILIWDAETVGFIEQRDFADVCGIAPDKGEDFLASSGTGHMTGAGEAEHPGYAWDNHLRLIG